jgi:hypothetical protein
MQTSKIESAEEGIHYAADKCKDGVLGMKERTGAVAGAANVTTDESHCSPSGECGGEVNPALGGFAQGRSSNQEPLLTSRPEQAAMQPSTSEQVLASTSGQACFGHDLSSQGVFQAVSVRTDVLTGQPIDVYPAIPADCEQAPGTILHVPGTLLIIHKGKCHSVSSALLFR